MNIIKISMALCGLVILAASCKYDEVADAPYPAQSIYFPAAVNGPYFIDNIAAPNMPFRYVVDFVNRKFNVPLSVYRSGVNNTGGFNIDIAIDNDTINSLISNGDLLAGSILLPENQYEVATAVEMVDGEEVAPFTLSIDIDYLLSNPDHQLALCLQLSSSKIAPATSLVKVIVVIDPAILRPAAGFDVTPDDNDPRMLQISNTSKYALNYAWDFGDGTKSEEASPSHTYTAAGTYTIKLTAIGVVGEATQAILTQTVTIP